MATTERRLAAIMLADIAGYSALMERDETGTFERVRNLRELLTNPKVAEFGGRIVKTTGDGFLAEFPSATAALGCGIAIQRMNHAQEADKDEAERLHLRLGINLGDIIIDGEDVSGDGVNVAARLEPLAPLDGICVSGAVRDQVREDLGVVLEDLGEQHVKNISRPIRAYRINLANVPVAKPMGRGLRPRMPWIGAIVASIVLVAVGGLVYRHHAAPPAPRMSVVVLPFTNSSGDPSQEYMADAITEEITIQLSKIKDSFVIGRNTAFTFKGKPVDLKTISKELGVRYVLEGTVARNENRFHVTTQLVDGASGANIWADSLDADSSRAEEIRREVVSRLAVTLNLQLVSADARKAEATNNPDAIDLSMRAWARYYRGATKENVNAARQLFGKALETQPDFEPSLAGRAMMTNVLVGVWTGPDKDQQILEEEKDATEAVRLDPSDAAAYFAVSRVKYAQGHLAEAILANDRALELNPNLVEAVAYRGLLMIFNGQAASAFETLQRALACPPLIPNDTASCTGGVTRTCTWRSIARRLRGVKSRLVLCLIGPILRTCWRLTSR